MSVNGSGVNIKRYAYTIPCSDPVTFIMASRLVIEKGFEEFIEAAKLLKKNIKEANFILLGGTDENPNSINPEKLHGYKSQGIIDWPGMVNNVDDWLTKSSVFVLPSYYREGTPEVFWRPYLSAVLSSPLIYLVVKKRLLKELMDI